MILYSITGALAWVSHLKGYTYLEVLLLTLPGLDTLRKPAYNGKDVKVRFAVNPDSFTNAALKSTRYVPFQLVNYPRNCIFPTQPSQLKKPFQYNGKHTGKGISLHETLVFKIAHAFVVGGQDQDGNPQQLAFQPHQYCMSISVY
jgi:hypothetical protein